MRNLRNSLKWLSLLLSCAFSSIAWWPLPVAGEFSVWLTAGGQAGCWLAGPWAGLLAGWLLGGLLLTGRLGGWPAVLWARFGWLAAGSGRSAGRGWAGWLVAAGWLAGWLQRVTGEQPATGGQPPGGQSVPCRAC